MRNLKTLYLLLFLVTTCITISSCKKDEIPACETNNEEPSITTNDYFPASIGSYWVYEFDAHQPDGTINQTNTIDTLKVTGDTVIDGETYFVFSTDIPLGNTVWFRRVDQGEVVSQSGRLVCPPDNSYTGIYNSQYNVSGADTVDHFWEEFSGYETVSTNFGETHDCIQKTTYHKTYPNYGDQIYVDTSYYSPIGILQRSYSYFSGAKRIGVLIDYHIE